MLGAYPCRERVPPPSLFWDGGSSSSLPDVHSRVVSFYPERDVVRLEGWTLHLFVVVVVHACIVLKSV